MRITPTWPQSHTQLTMILWRCMSCHSRDMGDVEASSHQHVRTSCLLAAYGLVQRQQELGVHDGVHGWPVGGVRVQQGEHKGCFLRTRLRKHPHLP